MKKSPLQFALQSGLTFVEAGHEYRLHDVPAVSVSHVLRLSGLKSPLLLSPTMTESVLDRGRRFHMTLASLLLSDTGDMVRVDDENVQQTKTALQWASRNRLVPITCEAPMIATSPMGYLIGGTVDLLGTSRGNNVIVDWKRGMVTPANMIQMAAYLWLARSLGYEINRGVVVDCSTGCDYSPNGSAILTWTMLMRTFDANERTLLDWCVSPQQ